jgi:hypothetical protein
MTSEAPEDAVGTTRKCRISRRPFLSIRTFSSFSFAVSKIIFIFATKTKCMSPVFRRESEYTFKIYSNEEERLHIHVIHDRCEAKYWLEPKVELAKNTGFSEHELNRIKKLVEKYADRFKEQFRQHVGKRIDD